MAFFTLEDQSGEVECIAFARQYVACAHLIRNDIAVCVTGTTSVREDEPPKVLVARMEELVENAEFRDTKPAGAAQTEEVSRARNSTREPKRLFLRVPDREGLLYRKAKNLADIFDGSFPVAYYDASAKQYDFSAPGIALSDYVLSELRALLGEENVILK